MPVRIYDISKKLGLENKEVLAKAKELGIATARVPSSSLDKITAEYLESHLKPAAPAPEPVVAPSAPEPVVIVSAPPVETAPPVAEVIGESEVVPGSETAAEVASPLPPPLPGTAAGS